MLQRSHKIQVKAARALDIDGFEWVELTRAQLWHTFKESQHVPLARAFALIDGTSLGLGRLLKGPLPPEEHPEPPPAVPKPAKLDDGETAQLAHIVQQGPLLPALPENLILLAQQFLKQGWAHIACVGANPKILKKVEKELKSLESDMEQGQQNAHADFHYRSDRRLFFDTGPEQLRRDIPGLNKLVDSLQGLVATLGPILERSPLRLCITGRCRPMVARYDASSLGYLPHVDSGDGDGRILTAVYYFNRGWKPEKGGALRLHPTADRRSISNGSLGAGEDAVEILPEMDSLVLFRADWIVHEVEAANAERFALTLWFLGN